MAEGMTEPDGDGTTFAICDIEHLCKQVVKAALPKYRWEMWDECTRMIKAMAEASLEFPWDSAESISDISARRAQEVLRSLVGAVPDPGERARLARVATREAERLEARLEANPDAAVPAGKYPVRCCANANCGKRYRPKRSTSKYCSPAFRTAHWKAARKAAGRDG